MNAEASPAGIAAAGGSADAKLTGDLKLRLQGALAQERAARAEARRLARELTLARRLLQFFFDGPPPERAVVATDIRPATARLLTAETRFHLDACRTQGMSTAITGWAFRPVAAWDGRTAKIELMLRHGATAYAAATGRFPRPDVATYFAAQPAAAGGARGLDGTGFACEILNDSLPAGVDLEIVLRLECAGLTCEQPTGQTLRF